MGVIDPFDILEDGEVFVQICPESSETMPFVLEGKVLITRNPCMHVGDMRYLSAKYET
jgi:RNA-dependent RNA polymerase